MKKPNSHDKIIKSLEKRLNNSITNYKIVQPNVDYHYGECDLMAVKEYDDGRKVLLLFEVKTNNNPLGREKAEVQLRRDLNHFYNKEFSKVYTFYVYGNKKRDYEIKRKHLGYKNRKRKTTWFNKNKIC